jgi:hypothetical protein
MSKPILDMGRAFAIAALVLTVLTVGTSGVWAGGQGVGLGTPIWVGQSDDSHVLAEIQAAVGAAPPLWVWLSDGTTPCTDPQLTGGVVFPVTDGIGGSELCIPDFISGATLSGSISTATVFSEVNDPNDNDIVERTISIVVTLEVNVPGAGDVTIQTLDIPETTYQFNASEHLYLSSPPLISRVGWAEASSHYCQGPLVMDGVALITLERVAASNDPYASGHQLGGLDRGALVAAGLQAFPDLLCEDQGSGCTVSPAVVGIDPATGLLEEPFNPTVVGSDVSCDVTIRFARGEAIVGVPFSSGPFAAVLILMFGALGIAVLAKGHPRITNP